MNDHHWRRFLHRTGAELRGYDKVGLATRKRLGITVSECNQLHERFVFPLRSMTCAPLYSIPSVLGEICKIVETFLVRCVREIFTKLAFAGKDSSRYYYELKSRGNRNIHGMYDFVSG